MAERPAAARSRSVGRCDLLVEVAKSQLGSLWVATAPGVAGREPALVRCLALAVTSDAREALAEAGRWSGGILEVVVEGSDLCLVSAYVPGETLRSLLRLANFKRSPLPTRIALRVILDVCEALLAAESRAGSAPGGPASLWGGLLPDSILVGVDGTTRVLEIGVASLWRQRASEAQHPEVISYCAPEQLDHRVVDARADVFILGIVLWEMLCGKRLFLGSSRQAVVEKLRKHDHAAAGAGLPADSVDAATRVLLDKLLDPDPGRRFGFVELRQALRAMGDAVALPRDVSDFVTSIAASSLDSRERVLARTLARALDPRVEQRVAEVVAAEPLRRSVTKPLPLPAQAKLGGLLSATDGLLRRPLPIEAPAEATSPTNTVASDEDEDEDEDEIEVEETGSVRAEDIMAALAVEDTEPESDDARGPHPPEARSAVVESTLVAAPPSSGRRASPTAVVVPSVLAAPDAEAFAPVPSVLQTLRGPGIPPPTFEFLLPLELAPGPESAQAKPASAPAAEARAIAATDQARASNVEPAQPVRAASAGPLGLPTPARGVSRLLDQRLPVRRVAVLSGAAFMIVMGLVFALGGGETESATERGPEVMGASTSDSDRIGSQVSGQVAAADAPRAGAPLPKPTPAGDEAAAAKSESPTPGDTRAANTAAEPATAEPVTAEPATPTRVRSKRSSGTLRTTAKKKKLRATRTYIPAGI